MSLDHQPDATPAEPRGEDVGEIRENDGWFRLIVDSSIEGVWTIDARGRTTFVNAAMAAMIGTTPDAMVGTMPADYVPPRLQERADPSDPSLEPIGDASSRRKRMLRRVDGVEVPVLASATPLYANGRDLEPTGSLILITDLRELAEAEDHIRRQADKAGSHAAQQGAAARLSQAALRDTPLTDLLDEAVQTIAEILAVDLVEVLLFDDLDPDQLRLEAASGFPDDLVGTMVVPRRGSMAGETLDGPGVAIWDAATDPDAHPRSVDLRGRGIASAVTVMIAGTDRAFGVLGVMSRSRRHFDADDTLFLQTMANVITAAIVRDRTELILAEVEEAERRRISEAIHDDPLQVMAAVALRLETLQRELHDPEIIAKVSRLVADTRLATTRLRTLTFDLFPEDLGDGLEPALRRLLDETGGDAGFAHDLEVDLSAEPPIGVRRALYRNAQEAIINIRKHAQARHVSVQLGDDGDGTRIRIVDDGIGIWDVEAKGMVRGHLGIKGMRDRTMRWGGRVTVTAGASGGTEVEFWMPHADGGHSPVVGVGLPRAAG
jgi:PAS domain S-box-containing protein